MRYINLRFTYLLTVITKTTYTVLKPTRNSTVALIADRTAYDVGLRYSYRSLSGIAVVSTSIYLFTVSNRSLLLIPVNV